MLPYLISAAAFLLRTVKANPTFMFFSKHLNSVFLILRLLIQNPLV